MKMFIERGVLATYTDILNQTVLYYVSREGKANCVDLLVKLGMCRVVKITRKRLQCKSQGPVWTDPTVLCGA